MAAVISKDKFVKTQNHYRLLMEIMQFVYLKEFSTSCCRCSVVMNSHECHYWKGLCNRMAQWVVSLFCILSFFLFFFCTFLVKWSFW